MFQLPDGRTVDLDAFPMPLSNLFIVADAEQGMELHFFQDDGRNLVHFASIGIPLRHLEQFVASVKEAAISLGLDWESIRIEPLPKSRPDSSGH